PCAASFARAAATSPAPRKSPSNSLLSAIVATRSRRCASSLPDRTAREVVRTGLAGNLSRLPLHRRRRSAGKAGTNDKEKGRRIAPPPFFFVEGCSGESAEAVIEIAELHGLGAVLDFPQIMRNRRAQQPEILRREDRAGAGRFRSGGRG